jgi:hypothetical protein
LTSPSQTFTKRRSLASFSTSSLALEKGLITVFRLQPSSTVFTVVSCRQQSAISLRQSPAFLSSIHGGGGRPGVWEEGQKHISVGRRAPRSSVLSGPCKRKRMCTHILGDITCARQTMGGGSGNSRANMCYSVARLVREGVSGIVWESVLGTLF